MAGVVDPRGKTEKEILELARVYARPKDFGQYSCGTAGFRMKEDLLDHVMFAVGLLSGIRSRRVSGMTVGVMITASHNPAEDNGVKVVDTEGTMLDQEWEKHAANLANGQTPEETQRAYMQLVRETKIDQSKPAHVIFARDTRPSGARLIEPLKAALTATGVTFHDYGMLTTPQLHYLVKAKNTENSPESYGEVSEEGYYKKLMDAFVAAMTDAEMQGPLTVDCANGVGAIALKKFLKHVPKGSENIFHIRAVNDEIENAGVLNKDCGADFVKTRQTVPRGFNGKTFDRWASFDGDADRLVYYYLKEGPQFCLLDGDRIATLVASFLGDLVLKSGLGGKINIGVVQTAYANGASTNHIQQTLRMKVDCTETGVKHLHRAASRFDIGVYFEANGHGTVLFSPKTLSLISRHEPQSPAELEQLTILRATTNLINQTVGDALSDLLLVEVVLAYRGFTVKEWMATYKDLPNQLQTCKVSDRAIFTTIPGTAEQRLQTPDGLQDMIDRLVVKYHQGRLFVRASGTEDAVRIYAEAAQMFDVEDMIGRAHEMVTNDH